MSEENQVDISVHDLAMGERKFLHDISNKIVVIQGMTKTVQRKISSGDEVGNKEVERLEKALNAVESMVELLKERRALLHELTMDED